MVDIFSDVLLTEGERLGIDISYIEPSDLEGELEQLLYDLDVEDKKAVVPEI